MMDDGEDEVSGGHDVDVGRLEVNPIYTISGYSKSGGLYCTATAVPLYDVQ